MLVKDIMTCNARTVHPDTQLSEAASTMCLYRFSGLPVVEDGKLVGFVAEKDILHRLFPSMEDWVQGSSTVDYDAITAEYKNVGQLKVREVMTPRVISVSPDMHALRAAAVMVANRFRRIPVADNGVLRGMISLGDVHKAIFQHNVNTMFALK
jgi:CBS domain-containing protein